MSLENRFEAELNQTLALHERGALDAVVPRYRALLQLAPHEARLWLNLGAALQGLGELEQARAAYDQAARHGPDLAEAAFNLGCVLSALDRPGEAAGKFFDAIRLNPQFSSAHYNLANALRRQGRTEAAIAAYEDAIRLRPMHADALNGLGIALRELGDISRSEAMFLQALACTPTHSAAFANLSTVHRFVSADPLLDLAKEMERSRAELPPQAQIEICYALGKIADDLGDPGAAMERFAEGAALMRARTPYDESTERALFAAIKSTLTTSALRANAANTCPSAAPIFVVGMPRSGTTLVEQILASHSAAHGGGELRELGRCLEGWVGPNGVDLSSGRSARERGEAYVAAINQIARPGASRVVDKMPDNFRYVGFIHLILPKATIIHCRRAPLDTCLSCYQTLFTEGNGWSYDLPALGRRYLAYSDMMRHWATVLPGRVVDVQYEDLVEQPEREVRRLLAACGLPFEPTCLEFHRLKRSILTASATQVRQPIYRSSVGRAARYRPYLAALIDALQVKGGQDGSAAPP